MKKEGSLKSCYNAERKHLKKTMETQEIIPPNKKDKNYAIINI